MQQHPGRGFRFGATVEDDGLYKTSDLYYAAFLKVAGVKLLEPLREGKRVTFVFESSEAIRDLKRDYFTRSAKVSALDFADEIRSMKSLIHLG